MSLVLLAQMHLDGGIERFSQVDVVSTSAFWKGKVLSFGDIYREVPVLPESPRFSSVRLTLANQDDYFGTLRNQENFKNRQLDIILADTERGEAQFTTIFTGIMEQPVLDREICEVFANGSLAARLEERIPFLITNLGFPWLPERTPRNFVPIVVGTVASTTGALPAYPVDEAIGTAAPKFRYVAAQHVLKSITEVYAYGVNQASGWAVNYVPGQDGNTLTVIDFDSNPFDSSKGSETEVTYNAVGMTDDGTSGGNAITNPAEQLEAVLLRGGFTAAEIDSTLRTDAADEYTQLNIQGGVAITEASRLKDILTRFANSFGLIVFQTKAGLVGMTAPTVKSLTSTPVLTLTDQYDVSENSFRLNGVDRLATKITAQLKPDYVTGQFLESQPQDDPVESGAQGRTVEDETELWYVRDRGQAADLLNSFLFYRREKRHVVSILATESIYGQVEIGDTVRLTHFAGPSADGSGFLNKPFRIVGLGLSEQSGLLLTRLSLVDLEDVEPFAFATETIGAIPIWASSRYNESSKNAPLPRLRLVS